MKKTLVLLAAFACINFAKAQTVEVKEQTESYAKGSFNSEVVTIYATDLEKVEKEWKDLLKDHKAKVEGKKGEYIATEAKFKEWEASVTTVHYRVSELARGEVRLTAAFVLGNTAISSGDSPEKVAVIKKMMYDFALKLSKEGANDQIKSASKIFEKADNNQKDLVKEKEHLDKKIVDNEAEIKKAQENISKAKSDKEQNAKNQAKSLVELEAAKKALEALNEKFKNFK